MIKVKTLSKVIWIAVFSVAAFITLKNHLGVEFIEQSLPDNFYYSFYVSTSSVGREMSLSIRVRQEKTHGLSSNSSN